jgi:hypothetical protein
METTTNFQEETIGRIFAEFSKPKTLADPVIVNRYLLDNAKERIGSIYSNFNEEDIIVFTCVDRTGKLLFPPTADYSVAEERFEMYAKQLTIQTIEKQRGGKSQEFAERISEIKNMRDKNQQEKDKQINR